MTTTTATKMAPRFRAALANLCTLVGGIEVPRIDDDPEGVAEEIIDSIRSQRIRNNDEFTRANKAVSDKAEEVERAEARNRELVEACRIKDGVITDLKSTIERRGKRYDFMVRDIKAYEEFMTRKHATAVGLAHERGDRIMTILNAQRELDDARSKYDAQLNTRDETFTAACRLAEDEHAAMHEEDARDSCVTIPSVANRLRVEGTSEEEIQRQVAEAPSNSLEALRAIFGG